ncbi:alkaline shock response membrane anchor protein AmaP [Streptomyces sp. XD-27]|uniref:alkaline shock response membrane anchor protein AmaP n=1 Tax=Streptomyces sp. XD-27 TaxID=3062779 RepID=UPI0026F40FBA|nr:alkaline shock response membrane anchor protein AmaP [Streptomyces sp. XD-27]WKX69665.1 alkaline shock response membrane anchor protein AmaP [Streptomyces sp. XD-27]
MLRTVNRVLLALTGLALLALGGAVLVPGLDLPRHWGFDLPSWWPFDGPRDVLLTRADRRRWRDEGWWWPTVLAALAVLVLLMLWWLLAQVRRRRLGEVLVPNGDGVEAALRCRALEAALEGEAESLDGVDRAWARLLGRRTAPEVEMGLLLAPHAEPAVALERIRGEVLEHARGSAGLARLPAEVRLRAVRHEAERVS